MKNLLCLLALLLVISSCDDTFSSTLEVDPPAHEDQLVIHAFIADTDSVLAFSITKSFGILDNMTSDQFIDDAIVELFENGQMKYTLESLGNTFQPINYGLELDENFGGTGIEYEVKATHPIYGTATAKQTMPTAVPMLSVQYKENAGIDDGERVDGVEITFQDPPGEENYYEFTMYRLDNNFSDNVYTGTNDPLLDEGIKSGSWLLSDETFDGKEYKFSLLAYNGVRRSHRIVVNSITKEAYRYSKAVRDQIDAEDFGLFSEPVSVSTNVEGGLGLFGLRTERFYEIEF